MISIVLPVYNEREVLPALYDRLSKAAAQWDCEYEVVLISDGSTDGSDDYIAELHATDPRWKLITLSRNFGHQAALSCGIQYARGDALVVMDADLQDPPEELGRFLEQWRAGHQVVYAIRTKRKENLVMRCAYSVFYRLLRRLACIDIPLDAGDFCVMDRTVADVLRSMPERGRFVRGLRSYSGFRQIGVAYERQARQAGQPKYTFTKLLKLALDGIFSFSSTPLKLASLLGIGQCVLSIGLLLVLVAWWTVDVPVFGMRPRDTTGWTSLASLLLLLSGLHMLVLGIMGEYLARVFDEVKNRPGWIVARTLGFEESLPATSDPQPTAVPFPRTAPRAA